MYVLVYCVYMSAWVYAYVNVYVHVESKGWR